MLRRVLVGAGLLLALVVVAEAAAMVYMKLSVQRYAAYWQERAREPGEFVYVALGDSTAQGIGATSPDKGYVGLLAERIARQSGKQVRIVNLSRTGAKARDVLEQQLPQAASYRPDLVTLAVGANDAATGNSAAFDEAYSQILAQLPPGKSVVATVPYFGGRVDANGMDMALSDTIRDMVAGQDFGLADLQTALKRKDSFRNYSADYFHPGNYGYRVWADAFWQAVEPRL